MHTFLMEKIFAFRVLPSLAGKRMYFKKLIASFIILLTVGIGAGGLTGTLAVAAPFIVLLETDADTITNQEIFIVSYDSYADLISNNQASGVFSQLNINPLYSVGGMTYDGSQFHVLLETDADTITNQEIFIVSYNSYADLISNNQASGVFSQLNINPLYSVGGMTYDGSQFHVLLETDADTITNQEIFIVSYDSYADLISNNQASGVFSQLNINPLYSVGGMTYDGSQFHVLLETDADTITNQEIFIVSYDSYADLISNNQASGVFSQLNINPLYSVGGMAALYTANGGNGNGNGNVVSEPATMMLVIIGLSFLNVFVRRKDAVCCQARI